MSKINVRYRGEAALARTRQKAALSCKIRKCRNKPGISKSSAACRLRTCDQLQSTDFSLTLYPISNAIITTDKH